MIRTKRPPRIKGRKLKAGERSLAYLRKLGYTANSCEQYKIMGSLADLVRARDEAMQRCNTLREWLRRVWAEPYLVQRVSLRDAIGEPEQSQGPAFRGGFRQDLHGFADIAAYNDTEALYVQTTSRQQMSGHLLKFRRDPEVRERILRWIRLPVCHFDIHGWECIEVACVSKGSKSPTRGKWECTVRRITAADLEP